MPSAIHKSGSIPRKKVWQNRRATVRYKCAPATSGRVYASEDTAYLGAWVQDLSQAGLGLVMTRAMTCGTEISVRVKASASQGACDFVAQVIHVTRQPSGDWLVGCEFLTKLSRDELDQLL